MRIFKSINKLHNDVNFKANIGFVPTMGSLHKGHISLIESARKRCEKVLVSIFVNPSQFNKKKDFRNYPKDILSDIKILKRLNVDYLFIPKTKDIYKSKKYMKIKIPLKDKVLCAKFRKGHFEGVLAVMNQLLKLIKAKYLFLGLKDFQQLYLIKKFIKNKYYIKVVPVKTVRFKNSLAYSSRNKLLSSKDIDIACKIAKRIYSFNLSIKKNFKNVSNLNNLKSNISKHNIKLEYLEIRNKFTLSKKINRSNYKIFIAYYLNNVRLIDNF